jgi:hypothetical protein
MATYSKIQLSGGTTGKNIKVVATATPGTLIHTAHATSIDEVWLWCANSDTVDRKLTIEFGGVAVPDDTIEITIPLEDGPYLVIPGWTLKNSLEVRAFAATANVLLINGFVNRIT